MSLVAHLTELRDRLLRAVLAVLVGFIILFPLQTTFTVLYRRRQRADARGLNHDRDGRRVTFSHAL